MVRGKKSSMETTKGNNSKIRTGGVMVLTHRTPTQWDLSTYEVSWLYHAYILSYTPNKTQSMKKTKGNNSKIRTGKVMVLVYRTPSQWDLSTYEVSWLYHAYILSYAQDKTPSMKRTKGNNSNIRSGRVMVLVHHTPTQ